MSRREDWDENWEKYAWNDYSGSFDDDDPPILHANPGFVYNQTLLDNYTIDYFEEERELKKEQERIDALEFLQELCMDSFFYYECRGNCMCCSWWFELCNNNARSYIFQMQHQPHRLSVEEYIRQRDNRQTPGKYSLN